MAVHSIRIIARLDVKGPKVINTVQLEGLRTVGNPNDLAIDYYNSGADEILIIDQVASLYQRGHLVELTKEFAKEVFIPITVGGGIRSVSDARLLLRAGADKVAVNSAATERPALISELSQEFGSQCVVVSIQCKQLSEGSWEVFKDGGRERTGLDVLEWSQRVVGLGAGELLITSIDCDGTRRGFDCKLMTQISALIDVPIIASGGLGAPMHAVELVDLTNCEAIAVADFLHMKRGGGISELKTALSQAGHKVRSEY